MGKFGGREEFVSFGGRGAKSESYKGEEVVRRPRQKWLSYSPASASSGHCPPCVEGLLGMKESRPEEPRAPRQRNGIYPGTLHLSGGLE